MQESTDGDSAKRNPLWQPEACVRGESSAICEMRRRAMIAIGALVASLALAGFAAWKYVNMALAPRPVVAVAANGWIFGGATTAFQMTEKSERSIWRQILKAHFLRTEKGTIPGLAGFSTPDTIASIDTRLRKSTSSYMVALTPIEDRVRQRNAMQAEVYYRARLTVVDKEKTASSEVFLDALFERFPATPDNITGWHLTGVKDAPREDFYEEERLQEGQSLLGVKGGDR